MPLLAGIFQVSFSLFTQETSVACNNGYFFRAFCGMMDFLISGIIVRGLRQLILDVLQLLQTVHLRYYSIVESLKRTGRQSCAILGNGVDNFRT